MSEDFKAIHERMNSMTPEDYIRYKMSQYTKERDNLETPHDCQAGYVLSNFGTPLVEIEPFTTELTGIVDTMKEQLATEVRILEGTSVPEYKENELSIPKLTEEQWRTHLHSGSSTTDPTPTSTLASSSSSCFVEASSLGLDTQPCVERSFSMPTTCCEGKSGDCGSATDASNESCACMVQTINVPMAGTPSEEK